MVNPNTAADQTSYNTPNAKTAIEVKAGDLRGKVVLLKIWDG